MVNFADLLMSVMPYGGTAEAFINLRTGLCSVSITAKGSGSVESGGFDGLCEEKVDMESETKPEFYFTELGLELIHYMDFNLKYDFSEADCAV